MVGNACPPVFSSLVSLVSSRFQVQVIYLRRTTLCMRTCLSIIGVGPCKGYIPSGLSSIGMGVVVVSHKRIITFLHNICLTVRRKPSDHRWPIYLTSLWTWLLWSHCYLQEAEMPNLFYNCVQRFIVSDHESSDAIVGKWKRLGRS